MTTTRMTNGGSNNGGSDDFDPYGDLFDEPEDPPTATERLRAIFTPKRIGVVAALLAVFIIGSVIVRQLDPPGPPGGEVVLRIPEGTTTTGITKLLVDKGVVPNQLAFRAYLRVKKGGPFQAGEYTFARNSSTGGALAVLREGPDMRLDRIIIPEGSRLVQIAQIVGRLEGMSSKTFLDEVRSGKVRSAFQPLESKNLEGFLFPDTYLMSASDTEETLLRRMVNQFDTVARTTGLDQSLRAVQLTSYNTLVIASMIEAEAKVPQDRGKISTVIQNRIERDMKLQIDATVLYALGNDRQSLSNNDLKVQSPYNTYLIPGLPPAPICNPGKASIAAALQPEPGPWLFYVVTEAGGAHSFATTGVEHQRNVKIARERGFVE